MRFRLPAVLCLLGVSPLAAQSTPDVAAPAPLTIGRLHYPGGGDWYANPSSLPNLLAAIGRQTGLPVARREVVVTLGGDELWSVPFLHMTGHGDVRFTDADRERLRRWLRQGGFLHVDDNYGMDATVRAELGRLFPGQQLQPVPLDHAIYRVVNRLPAGLPKIHEHDGKPAEGLGLFLGDRLVVFYSYESDLGDGWEDAGVHDDPLATRQAALDMGVNLFVYAIGGDQ